MAEQNKQEKEFFKVCNCMVTGLEREEDEIIVELRCPIEKLEEAEEAKPEEAVAGELKEKLQVPTKKILLEKGEVLLESEE